MCSMKRSLVIAAGIAAVAGGVVIAQQSATPRGSHDWAPSAPLGKHHSLAATLETVQWGWLDPARAAQAHRQLRRHGLDRDDDALARQGAARRHDGAGG